MWKRDSLYFTTLLQIFIIVLGINYTTVIKKKFGEVRKVISVIFTTVKCCSV
jgi:hypothetical protein